MKIFVNKPSNAEEALAILCEEGIITNKGVADINKLNTSVLAFLKDEEMRKKYLNSDNLKEWDISEEEFRKVYNKWFPENEVYSVN